MSTYRIKQLLAVVEIRTKLVSISSFLLGTLFAWRYLSEEGLDSPPLMSGNPSPGILLERAISMLFATLCVDMGTTAWNTYFDYLRGTDDPRINREPDKVLIHGELPPSYAFWTAFWLYMLAMVGGIVLSIQVGFWILPVGALCMAVGFLYNAGPLPISHTPVGELFAGGFLGSGLFLISCGVQVAGRIHLGAPSNAWGAKGWTEMVLASLPSLFAVAAILAVNNACDTEGDRMAGRKTFAVLFGKFSGEILALVLAVLASIVGIALSWIAVLPQFGIYTFSISFLFTLYQFYRMHQRGFSHSTKSRNMKSILRVFGVWSLAYGGALLVNNCLLPSLDPRKAL
ncbi:MAG: prenyltransferase [Spirochaetes bacterium]|nr:prenyltransferase [Spirochaetota bacterium]